MAFPTDLKILLKLFFICTAISSSMIINEIRQSALMSSENRSTVKKLFQ